MQFDHLKRREFIALLGGAAAWPLTARAQQAAVPVVGFLDAGSAAERTQQVAAFRKGLAEGGYQDGQNVALEFAWAEGQYSRFAELAAQLVRRKVAVMQCRAAALVRLPPRPQPRPSRLYLVRPVIPSKKGSSRASADQVATPQA